MNIAISNIAWNKEEDKKIITLLKKYGYSAIEIAPTMIWKSPSTESKESLFEFKNFWNKNGIYITSLQSLLFGHPELTIFENPEKRKKTLTYIGEMMRVSAFLGVEDIIFGSPGNRDKGDLPFLQAIDIASDFFNQVGDIAKKYGIFFCIEPIPTEYGTNFINNTEEGILLVQKVNHQHFRLHLDSGALTVSNEDYATALEKGYPYLKHFHISDRDLKPIGTTDVDHKIIAKKLKQLKFNNLISIEMRKNVSGTNEKIINQTLAYVSRIYR